MERFIIFGAGQHCNVVIYNAQEEGKYEPAVVADMDKQKAGSHINDILIKYYDIADKNTINQLVEEFKTNKFFIGFGNIKLRKLTFDTLVDMGLEPINIIHPDAVVAANANMGKGILIECGCLVTPNPIIGNNVIINTGAQINHDNVIGDHVHIAGGVILSGGVTINDNTLIGAGAIITLGRTVGKNCTIGAGSVVVKDIPDNVVAYGNPCRIARENIV